MVVDNDVWVRERRKEWKKEGEKIAFVLLLSFISFFIPLRFGWRQEN
jgi:hypothetical protein